MLEANQEFLNDMDQRPDDFGIRLKRPKFPQYAVVSKRLDSFKTWPDYLPLKSDAFVGSGLVYTGVGDSVRCYHCGGGLRNWEAVDIPWVEHAKWYPTCPHVLLVKGQSYVNAITRGKTTIETDSPRAEVSSPQPQEDHIKTVAAQSCIQNGFTEDSVRKAIEAFIQKNGHSNFKGADLCQVLFTIQDSFQTNKMIESEENASIRRHIERPQIVEEESGNDEAEEDIEELLLENQRLKDA